MRLVPQPKKKAGKGNRLTIILIKLLLFFTIVMACIVGGKYGLELGYEYMKNPSRLEPKHTEHRTVEVVIPGGASTTDIAMILKEKGLIKYPLLFRIASKMNENDGLYKQGKHVLHTSMEYPDMMNALKKTVKIRETARFTIPEGWELSQIVEKLSEQKLIDREKFMDLIENGDFEYAFLKDLPERENRLEGYLFPDTYEVYRNADEREIIVKMLNRFDEKFKPEYYERAKGLGMTVDEVVILASIIEREARLDSERPLVSAVFHNRLESRQYPFLQSCATVQYVLGERKPILSTEDTKIDSLYNTYRHKGLPIGPIASPGEKSIQAALYPDDNDYLFFVAQDDGSHVYSKTFNEHINAVNRIQRRK